MELSNIIEYHPSLPGPLTNTNDGVGTGNEAYTFTAPSLVNNPLTIKAPTGEELSWQPTELVYKDANGQFDYMVGSSPVSVQQINDNQVKYSRVYPMADDVFCTLEKGVKHWTILNEPPRSPAEYLGLGIKFGISGIVSGVKLPQGASDVIITDSFTLPQPVIKDLAGQEILGSYEVIGEQLFVWFDANYLSQATYPVFVDPTTIISQSYKTGYGDRKSVRLSNNWVIAVLADGSMSSFYVYKSADNGQTWAQLCYFTGATNYISLASGGTIVYIVASVTATNDVVLVKFDAASVGNVQLNSGTYTSTISSVETIIDSPVIALDSTGALHVAWAGKIPTYPNSYNLRYTKSTTGGASWNAITNITTLNAARENITAPAMALKSNNDIVIAATFETDYFGASRYGVCVFNSNNSWQKIDILAAQDTQSYLPSIAIDSSNVSHVVWYGGTSPADTVQQIRYAKSTNGTTWTKSDGTAGHDQLTTGTYRQRYPSIAINPLTDEIYVFWSGISTVISTSYDQIRRLIYRSGAWGTITDLTNAATTSHYYPKSLWSKFNMNSSDEIRIIYEASTAVKYDSFPLNSPPLAPTLLTPFNGGYDRAQIIRLSWQHNDADAYDQQTRFDIIWQLQGTGTGDSITGYTTDQFYDVPANTFPVGVIEWQVRTYDQAAQVSPYSAQVAFMTADKPVAPTILNPTESQVIPIGRPTIQWSTSEQAGYQMQLIDNSNAIIWDTGDVTGTNKILTVGVDLVNNSTYSVKIKIRNSADLWSDWSIRTFSISFTPPAIPTITATASDNKIAINITNPTPINTEPTVVRNDLYRRETGSNTWIRLAVGLSNSGCYEDYNVTSGVSYDYYVRAYGTNEGYRDSLNASGSVTLKSLYLHDVNNPSATLVKIQYFSDKSEDWSVEGSELEFAGRKLPIFEFGQQEKNAYQAKIKIDDKDTWTKFQTLVKSKTTICARDPRGRKIFGVIKALAISDQFFGQEFALNILAVDCSENKNIAQESITSDGGTFTDSFRTVIDGGEF